ncbi:MAG: Helicase, C-terminal:Type III restriction enzyme, res subunit:DEAD/DEAH box helicase, N-terminal [Anaerolineae bacterium]|nr:MAG: Helicase, C-terminal:Type III restriction enzyme, res subunit:DEAD/DEAH box helicase, N-terminal [Anaerolineae bacterium]
MNVFDLRNSLIDDYASYVSSFIQIRDPKIKQYVDESIAQGLLWPDPLIQLNPSFEPGKWIDELCDEGVLHKDCARIFRRNKTQDNFGEPLRLHKHQEDAIRVAKEGFNYVLTTGTGSGKSLAYIIPIVDYVLRHCSGKGIRAIIVYPMNALANSQLGELEKFLRFGFPDGKSPVTFERYTGQENDQEKNRIMSNPPDILLTNYVMLELILTRPQERKTLVNAAQGLSFLVLDELHTYRGRQGADVSMLVRRVREALQAHSLQCIGTSATLAGSGSFEDQQTEVAGVASIIFGDTVHPQHVIGETLRRTTQDLPEDAPQFIEELRRCIQNHTLPENYETFKTHPLARWVESQLGLSKDPLSGRFVRARPRSLTGEEGIAKELSRQSGLSEEVCVKALQEILLCGFNLKNPQTNFPLFAFRLHQFISRGDTVYASLEEEQERHVTVYAQKYAPGLRGTVLLPLAFCRECGQEYYVVRRTKDRESQSEIFLPRQLNQIRETDDGEAGFLYLSSDFPWPDEISEGIDRLPDDWLEERNGELVVKRSQKKNLPETLCIDQEGKVASRGQRVAFTKAPFRFCLRCGVSYSARQSSDFAKLTELSSGGRSTDTTILSLSLIRRLRQDDDLPKKARKLLSFTDNRQDASLQAGHFNDFVEIILLRSALYRAVHDAGEEGISHERLTQKVFTALNLPFTTYASDPEVRYAQKAETDRALREVLGYRIYRDLKRGWRITSPNLEQCGLLKIEYWSLEELCSDEDVWAGKHPALVSASPDTRKYISRVLLDFMRRELAIKVSYLDPTEQESLRQISSQRLIAPWAIDENEILEHASIIFPRSKQGDQDEYGGNVFLSPRGGYGQFLRRATTFREYPAQISLNETEEIIAQILHSLRLAGLVEIVVSENDDIGHKPGYQLLASGMIWKEGDGRQAFHDPIRVPRLPEGGGKTNPFFVKFYREVTNDLLGIEAREHTAQVPSKEREGREAKFRNGDLPILFCSPTMELGVDIAELNAVNLRNVPPTPANYAQRSGRAGRSGQPALVFTYCTIGSPHDQYYFKRPESMVGGAVSPPRIDLANEDLVRSHVQAIWLAESGLDLGTSLKDLLDLSGDPPGLTVWDFVRDALRSTAARSKAKFKAQAALRDVENDLKQTDWWNENWLDSVLEKIELEFEQACERWRSLYRAAKHQQKVQHAIISDPSRSSQDKQQAKRLRQEAESQLELLTEAENIVQSDFYSYRYFASEGFLPGYSFPRLPLSAYIPARRIKSQDDEFLSRPRFLAISEFGPRAIIYHEGSRYIIHKVNLPVSETGEGFSTLRAKQCQGCGYFHPVTGGDGVDRCEWCGALLEPPLNNLFRLQNVSTKRRDRILSDEEERLRQGYKLRTAIRFNERSGQLSAQKADVYLENQPVASLTYGHAAKLWRINLGWRRRTNPQQLGFVLDIERGYWARKQDDEQDSEVEDPMSAQTLRVIPYVEDHKNCLIFEPAERLSPEQMASLQAALKHAIQVEYQLEDNELAAEPLPDSDERRLILFYEAAEGGAGVLRHLVSDPNAFARVAFQALQLCHFDPRSGADVRRAPNAKEDCEAACYDCLMSYYNQMDHRLLDRHSIKEFLQRCSRATIHVSPKSISRAEHYQRLYNLCQSDLERQWLAFIEKGNYRLPSHAQWLIECCHTRPDFFYEQEHTAIYVDGPHHDYPQRQQRDREQQECMEDSGYTVIRFSDREEWERVVRRYPSIFGAGKLG